LRLQLVKRLAEASGFVQAEVERLCELKSFRPPAPAKAPRAAHSLSKTLLKLVLQKPVLALRLPVDLLPDAPERGVLLRLHDLTAEGGILAYAALRERLRGSSDEAVVEAAAAELLGLPFDEDEVDAEFAGAIARLQEGGQKRAFAELQATVQRVGVAGLSAEEKAEYLRLLSGRGKGG